MLLGNETDHSFLFVCTLEDVLLPCFLSSSRCGADTQEKLSHQITLDQGFQVMSLHKSVTISYIVLNARYLIFLDILTIFCQTYNDEAPVVQFLPSFCYWLFLRSKYFFLLAWTSFMNILYSILFFYTSVSLDTIWSINEHLINESLTLRWQCLCTPSNARPVLSFLTTLSRIAVVDLAVLHLGS
jgi:hypothetical protein